MPNDIPVIPQRRSSRRRVPNINHQEVFTLNEAADVRSRLTVGELYYPLITAYW